MTLYTLSLLFSLALYIKLTIPTSSLQPTCLVLPTAGCKLSNQIFHTFPAHLRNGLILGIFGPDVRFQIALLEAG